MIWFKSCPRCETGDIVREQDQYGLYTRCLQCGYVKDADEGGDTQPAVSASSMYRHAFGNHRKLHRQLA